MSRDPRLRLADVVECAERATSYAGGTTLAEFAGDHQVQDAVTYALLVIGEATKHVPTDLKARAPGVDRVGATRFRDRAAHGYDSRDVAVIWRIVREILPGHRAGVAALLAELDAENPPEPE